MIEKSSQNIIYNFKKQTILFAYKTQVNNVLANIKIKRRNSDVDKMISLLIFMTGMWYNVLSDYIFSHQLFKKY